MLPQTVLHRGSNTALSPPEIVRAGPLTARFDPDGVFLRHIRLGDREVLRGIYVAVRDQNWNTIAPAITSIDVTTSNNSFAIDVEVACKDGDVDFVWHGEITGKNDGTIRYSMDGTARSSFWRNRIGILVLHPPKECAGQPCTIESPDGSTQSAAFPELISPHQPFFNIQAMTHQLLPGLDAEVRFAGDVFETEDQRNWTDASYKTYSTPLDLPFPVFVEEGTTVSQSVELRLIGEVPASEERADNSSVKLTLASSDPIPLPPIGLVLSSDAPDLTDRQIDRLQRLGLGHLRVDLHLEKPDVMQTVERAWEQAEAINIPLQPALFVSKESAERIREVVEWLAEHEAYITEWLMFGQHEKVASSETVDLAQSEIATYDPDAIIASGTNAYFTELNRERPDTEPLDAICYSINPQVHAFDDLSLVETLEAQSWTVDSARAFANERGIIVGPITLRPRFNPNATGPESDPEPGELPASVDPRQMSLLGAGWTLGSLKYISMSGVVCGTWFETVGWKGVMELETGSPQPDAFPSLPDSVFPLYHVFADFGDFRDGEISHLISSDPLAVDGCVLQHEGRKALLLANLSNREQAVAVEWPEAGEQVTQRTLDETTAEHAMTEPDDFRSTPGDSIDVSDGVINLTLRPFAYVRIDRTEQ